MSASRVAVSYEDYRTPTQRNRSNIGEFDGYFSGIRTLAVPKAAESKQRVAIVLKGEIPSAVHPPSGCRFHTRCPIAQSICHEEEPVMSDIDSGHLVACHFGDSASNRMRAMLST